MGLFDGLLNGLGFDGRKRPGGQRLAAESGDGTTLRNPRREVNPAAGFAPDGLELQLLDAHRRQ